jgi:hypothetical protein
LFVLAVLQAHHQGMGGRLELGKVSVEVVELLLKPDDLLRHPVDPADKVVKPFVCPCLPPVSGILSSFIAHVCPCEAV